MLHRRVAAALTVAAALLASYPARAGESGLHLEIRASEEHVAEGDDMDVEVRLHASAAGHVLAYPDAMSAGNRGLLRLECLRPNGEPCREIHIADAMGTPGGAPVNTEIGPGKPLAANLKLKAWYEFGEPGEYQIAAHYKAFSDLAPGGVAELTAAPALLHIHDAAGLPALIPAPDAPVEVWRKYLRRSARFVLPPDPERLAAAFAAAPAGTRPIILEIMATLPVDATLGTLIRLAQEVLEKDKTMRSPFRAAFAAVGKTRAQQLAEAHTKASGVLRQVLLYARALVGDAGVAGEIASLAKSTDGEERAAAAKYLGRLQQKEARPMLIEMCLRDRDASVRRAAIMAIAYVPDDSALPCLQEALASADEATVVAAVRYAGFLDNYRLADQLIDLLGHDSFVIRQYAYPALKRAIGVKLPFDFDGGPNQRAYQVRQIRDWWASNRENFEKPGEVPPFGRIVTVIAGLIFLLAIGRVAADWLRNG